MSAHALTGLAVFSECETVRALAITVVTFLVARALSYALALKANNQVANALLQGKHEAIFAPASDDAVVDFLAWVVPLLADVLSRLGLISVLGACVREVQVLVPLKSERAIFTDPSRSLSGCIKFQRWSDGFVEADQTNVGLCGVLDNCEQDATVGEDLLDAIVLLNNLVCSRLDYALVVIEIEDVVVNLQDLA